jgi:L-arabinokinase
LEVAVLRSFAALLRHPLQDVDLARLCQIAENQVVGAPCGIMDPMTCALGQSDHLLALRCQPSEIEGHVPIPASLRFWGIDSGIRHTVSGSDYGSVRTGAAMGYRIIADLAGLPVTDAGPGAVTISDPRWGGYLSNISPREFEQHFAAGIPPRISGRDFLSRYHGIADPAVAVHPDQTYDVSAPTVHPIEEHQRVRKFREILTSETHSEDDLLTLAGLMHAAHDSYSACGLGSEGTDQLVELARAAGPSHGIWGARITGGGSGGTVAMLGHATAGAVIAQIADSYTRLTGRVATVFAGSSPGACHVPAVMLPASFSVRP